jgi:hypothetical protein
MRRIVAQKLIGEKPKPPNMDNPEEHLCITLAATDDRLTLLEFALRGATEHQDGERNRRGRMEPRPRTGPAH